MNFRTAFWAVIASAVSVGPVLVIGAPVPKPQSSSRIVKVLQLQGMDKSPVPLKQVVPDYPLELRELGIQGVATVDMLIDSTGRVVSTELVSATTKAFGRLALAAARQWTFEPATANGRPVTTRVRVPFDFVMPQLVAQR